VLNDGEVLVKVQFSAINRADVHQRKGEYPPPPGATDILGLECAGHIVLEGANTPAEKLGPRVLALLPGGGYAQYAKVHASNLIEIPDSVSF
jgi:NADPH:quinone reductase-like Zn-dependent oxidoreductase